MMMMVMILLIMMVLKLRDRRKDHHIPDQPDVDRVAKGIVSLAAYCMLHNTVSRYSVQCTYKVQCMTCYCTLYSVFCTLQTVCLYPVPCLLYAVSCTVYTVCKYTVCIYTVYLYTEPCI